MSPTRMVDRRILAFLIVCLALTSCLAGGCSLDKTAEAAARAAVDRAADALDSRLANLPVQPGADLPLWQQLVFGAAGLSAVAVSDRLISRKIRKVQ